MLFGKRRSDEACDPQASAVPNTGRRKFVAVLGLTGFASFLGMGRAEAANPILNKIPKSWLRLHGRQVYDYANYLEKLNLKHLDTIDLLRPHFNKRGRVQNILPPKSMWKNMKSTLRAADKLAGVLGCGVKRVCSMYRSPRYNRVVGGKSQSYHMRNNAIDITFNCNPYYAARVARKLRSKGYFRGGVGDYSAFIHLDTRGKNADW